MATRDQVYYDTPAREQSRILHETAVEERLLGRKEGAADMRERAAKLADPPLMHRKGKPGLWRTRRAAIAQAIRALPLDEGGADG